MPVTRRRGSREASRLISLVVVLSASARVLRLYRYVRDTLAAGSAAHIDDGWTLSVPPHFLTSALNHHSGRRGFDLDGVLMDSEHEDQKGRGPWLRFPKMLAPQPCRMEAVLRSSPSGPDPAKKMLFCNGHTAS